MIRATTPKHIFKFPFDINNNVEKMIITYKQSEMVLEKTLSDCTVEGNIVSYTLSQDETKKFEPCVTSIQVRVLTKGGQALASNIVFRSVEDVLDDKVL